MGGAEHRESDLDGPALTFTDAARVAATVIEARWPRSTAIVIWRGPEGSEAITSGMLVRLGSLDIGSDADVFDCIADIADLVAEHPADSNSRAERVTSAVTVPLLVEDAHEGLISVVGIREPLRDLDHLLIRRVAALLATIRHRDVQLERALDAAASLHREARTDPLTALLNRRGFLAELEDHFSHAEDAEFDDVLLLADVRGLKDANDRFGHAFGDQLLLDVALALRAAAVPGDAIARFGGDEFAVILCGAGASIRAHRFAAEVQHGLDRIAGPRPMTLEVAFGIQKLSEVESGAQALELADNAMFRRPS